MSVLEMRNAAKLINNGPKEKKTLLDHIDLSIKKNDFITVLGGNGAGKSTLFNTVSGSMPLSSGKIFIGDKEVTQLSEENRASSISRVFQDPKMGTAPRMTVAENLLLAKGRGKKRRLRLRQLKQNLDHFYQITKDVGNGLENHLHTPAGDLSGGQRQALSLLMATIQTPQLLLLDEHTAALDPKTSKLLMQLTDQRIQEQQLTCLMITHRMEDALQYGNRMIVMQKGEIMQDLNEEEKAKLSMPDLLQFFEEIN
ncbi:ABC transporter ATP-binding protein [Tetragenococcus muriaticus]|uniref:ATP-binding component of an ABC superfamily transporter n=1 Tax=Tetragenococcus muriaticus 3MR10-3 TaxID=1302648 RepID=A0A091BZK5_9ENTE|nr:ATP-binding cassette domain-containing protein [Tetragenococcus muriaticus]KFN91031.1 ATP-binding component of an ABC superfamily transporter [Tetragenococcus muriaticus 3MR10-3]